VAKQGLTVPSAIGLTRGSHITQLHQSLWGLVVSFGQPTLVVGEKG
jgi:hypothetical protein